MAPGDLQAASRMLQVMAIALEHPVFSADPTVLCAAARTNRALRQAVQQCNACRLEVAIKPNAPLAHLFSFVRWLRKHAHLIKSFTAKQCVYMQEPTVDGLPWETYVEMAQLLLQPAMQLAAVESRATAQPPGAAAAAAAPPQPQPITAGWLLQQQQQQQGLRLASFSSNYLGTLDMLAVLPAHSLTHLDLNLRWNDRHLRSYTRDGSTLSAALARLSSLRRLNLHLSYVSMSGSCLIGLAQLKQLTSLTVSGVGSSADQQQLPQLLAQPLPLRQLHLDTTLDMPCVDMSGLTQLQEVHVAGQLHKNSLLPGQLQRLQVACYEGTGGLEPALGLTQLQRLQLDVRAMECPQLLRVTRLPALQHLSLDYMDAPDAAATAAAWRHLPQLRNLIVSFDGDHLPSQRQMAAILAGIAASTGLTQLKLEVLGCSGEASDGDDDAGDRHADRVAACASLAGLVNLKDLHIRDSSELVPGDALALTTLTGLTRLKLGGLQDAVGDLAASALACNLRQLQHLNLQRCSLGGMVCLASIAQLTQLTELLLGNNAGLTQQGLMLLTGLKRLQQLEVCRNDEVTDVLVDRFWHAVRRA